MTQSPGVEEFAPMTRPSWWPGSQVAWGRGGGRGGGSLTPSDAPEGLGFPCASGGLRVRDPPSLLTPVAPSQPQDCRHGAQAVIR